MQSSTIVKESSDDLQSGCSIMTSYPCISRNGSTADLPCRFESSVYVQSTGRYDICISVRSTLHQYTCMHASPYTYSIGASTTLSLKKSATPFPNPSNRLELLTPLPNNPYTTKCTARICGNSTLSIKYDSSKSGPRRSRRRDRVM